MTSDSSFKIGFLTGGFFKIDLKDIFSSDTRTIFSMFSVTSSITAFFSFDWLEPSSSVSQSDALSYDFANFVERFELLTKVAPKIE